MLDTKSWTAEFSSAFKNSNELQGFLGWTLPGEVDAVYPLFVPLRLAEKIKAQGPDGPLARQFLPQTLELHQPGLMDPIGDREFNRAPQLIHRYRSRALFTPTTICPVHCRYCFRKNELNAQEEMFQADFRGTVGYLKDHPEITEIIFTGGDPLTVSNEKLEKYLKTFSELGSIRDIRFHTRFPIILPERLDQGFLSLIEKFSKKFRTLSLAIHVNHLSEIDEEIAARIRTLEKARIQLLSQTVLLKGVNDSSQALLELFEKLMDLGIRPYYLHHPDQVKGGLHFYLPLVQGRELYSQLRDHLPGWALPHYVIDIPEGHGKVAAFNPETFQFSGNFIGRTGDLHVSLEPEQFT
jgi:lysine 2,3-aminomutase